MRAGPGEDPTAAGTHRSRGRARPRTPSPSSAPYGETVLDGVPQRIAVVGGLGDLETVVALGLAPVLTPWTVEDMGWLVGREE